MAFTAKKARKIQENKRTEERVKEQGFERVMEAIEKEVNARQYTFNWVTFTSQHNNFEFEALKNDEIRAKVEKLGFQVKYEPGKYHNQADFSFNQYRVTWKEQG